MPPISIGTVHSSRYGASEALVSTAGCSLRSAALGGHSPSASAGQRSDVSRVVEFWCERPAGSVSTPCSHRSQRSRGYVEVCVGSLVGLARLSGGVCGGLCRVRGGAGADVGWVGRGLQVLSVDDCRSRCYRTARPRQGLRCPWSLSRVESVPPPASLHSSPRETRHDSVWHVRARIRSRRRT